jgi:hypothetical protein
MAQAWNAIQGRNPSGDSMIIMNMAWAAMTTVIGKSFE